MLAIAETGTNTVCGLERLYDLFGMAALCYPVDGKGNSAACMPAA